MKKLGILLLAVSCLAGSALAQDAQKTQLANDVVKAINADKMFDGMVGEIKQMVVAQTSMYLPATATPEQKAKIELLQKQAETIGIEEAKGLVGKVSALYAEVYSVEELTAIKAFFNSPEGKSLQAKQPLINEKLRPLVQQMQADVMPKLRALVEAAKPAPAPAATATTAPISVTTEPVSAPAPAPVSAKATAK